MTRFSHKFFLMRKAAGRNSDRTSAPRCQNRSRCSAATRAEPIEPEWSWFRSTRCRFRAILLLGWILFSQWITWFCPVLLRASLPVSDATDQLEQKVTEFFVNAKKNKPEWREEQMEIIKKDYYKALEDADEKVQLANQIYDLVDRHLRKLDQELAKFKMELEADNAGITEILERRSLEMDSPSQPVNNHHVHSHSSSEKRKYSAPTHHTTEHVPEKKFKSEALLSTLTSDASKENTPGCRANSTSSSTNSVYSVNPSQPLAPYSLSSLPAGPGAGAGAITMAAAQAVQATAQMKEGRRTSSLKASYEAIKNNDFQLGREFSLTRENSGYSSSALASTLTQNLTPSAASDSRGRKSKSSIKSSNHQSSSSSSSSSLSSCSSSSALAQELSQQAAVLPEADANSQVDWTYDPNEPRYCICNQVSYGEMVGCDNTDCPIEWFHYGCVGLTEAPKGKWFCPQCTAAMKRRGSRHK
ncbi:inhibitor of growth protein 3 isoform X1 [Poecilia formosa]|uniref:inhibitor of growth protein 3 isoform X1 n=1 Tax=Poecilia formosa TaxID=48698 RepID=UPI000443CA43|nr:PREDICTED: inhibitor of growth protein 3 isoform X1 [Poecilia formosa]XP_007543568.1 PREDICTED: inhibitor of growth protein 3 isoform X1 [Poecilia formosa]